MEDGRDREFEAFEAVIDFTEGVLRMLRGSHFSEESLDRQFYSLLDNCTFIIAS